MAAPLRSGPTPRFREVCADTMTGTTIAPATALYVIAGARERSEKTRLHVALHVHTSIAAVVDSRGLTNENSWILSLPACARFGGPRLREFRCILLSKVDRAKPCSLRRGQLLLNENLIVSSAYSIQVELWLLRRYAVAK